jgi:hypothetical protein
MFVMSIIENLLSLSRVYAKAEKVGLTTVSWRVFGDTKKLRALENGGDLQTKRAACALQWFSDNWPANACWPEKIDRPSSSESEVA